MNEMTLVERVSLAGNKHLLRCDDMWCKLLQHFDRKGCIANINRFLASRNRIIQRPQQQAGDGEQAGQQQMRPLSAQEQQFRYPQRQSQNAAMPGDRDHRGPGYSHGELRPLQGYRHDGRLRHDGSQPGPTLA